MEHAARVGDVSAGAVQLDEAGGDVGVGGHVAGAEEQGVELRAEEAPAEEMRREARGGPEVYRGVYAAEERGGVIAGLLRVGHEAEGSEEERGKETRVAVAAAGEEEGVRLQ